MLTLSLCLAAAVPALATAAGVPLVDPSGASRGAASVNLTRGSLRLKIAGLAPLPADVNTGTETFTAHVYKAYVYASGDPAVEIFLGDVYPSARQRATRRVALGGDVSRMGLDRIVVTAFSKNGQKAFDVVTGNLAP
jgi:hypothetical protein